MKSKSGVVARKTFLPEENMALRAVDALLQKLFGPSVTMYRVFFGETTLLDGKEFLVPIEVEFYSSVFKIRQTKGLKLPIVSAQVVVLNEFDLGRRNYIKRTRKIEYPFGELTFRHIRVSRSRIKHMWNHSDLPGQLRSIESSFDRVPRKSLDKGTRMKLAAAIKKQLAGVK